MANNENTKEQDILKETQEAEPTRSRGNCGPGRRCRSDRGARRGGAGTGAG